MPMRHTIEVTFEEGKWAATPVAAPGDTVIFRFKGNVDKATLAENVAGVVPKSLGDSDTTRPFVGALRQVGQTFEGEINPLFEGDRIDVKIELKSGVSAGQSGGGICIKTQPPPGGQRSG